MKTIMTSLLIGSYLLAYIPDAGTAAISKREKLETGYPAAMLTTADVAHTNNPILSSTAGAAAKKTFTTTNGHVSFFAKAPVSDVDARNDRVKITLDPSSGELMFNIAMGDFKFQNKKMGRDARRKYIEIDKFPRATFSGKITGHVDYDQPGSYPVTAKGKLEIHGVEREVSEKGTIKVQKGQVKIESRFDVALKDHNIETPKILGQEMTDDVVIVKVDATLAAKSG